MIQKTKKLLSGRTGWTDTGLHQVVLKIPTPGLLSCGLKNLWTQDYSVEAFLLIMERKYFPQGIILCILPTSGVIAQSLYLLVLFHVYSPYFRSDLHGEVVVVNLFEEEHPETTALKGYTLYTSLELYPIYLVRLISSGINSAIHVSSDPLAGMAQTTNFLPR